MDKKILINGKIYTEDKRNPWAEAVAIEDSTLPVQARARKYLPTLNSTGTLTLKR